MSGSHPAFQLRDLAVCAFVATRLPHVRGVDFVGDGTAVDAELDAGTLDDVIEIGETVSESDHIDLTGAQLIAYISK